MAYKRRLNSQSVRLTGAPVGVGDTVVWRAPYGCRVVYLRAYRVGGTAATVNGKINAVNILTTAVTAGNAAYTTGSTDQTLSSGVNSGKMAAGDVLIATVVSSDATTLLWQADIEIDADVYET